MALFCRADLQTPDKPDFAADLHAAEYATGTMLLAIEIVVSYDNLVNLCAEK